jgi:hypothetical protein
MSVLQEETLKALNHLVDYEPHQSRHQKAKKALLNLMPRLMMELLDEQPNESDKSEKAKESQTKRKSADAEEGDVKAKKSVSIKSDRLKGKQRTKNIKKSSD